MADDTKYKDIFYISAYDGSTQLFAIDRDYKLWTMYLTGDGWQDWQPFTMPGNSGGVIKIYGSPARTTENASIYYLPRLWAIDTKNDLWSCLSQSMGAGPSQNWTSWAPWVAPYPWG